MSLCFAVISILSISSCISQEDAVEVEVKHTGDVHVVQEKTPIDPDDRYIKQATQLIYAKEDNKQIQYHINQEALDIISSNFKKNKPFEIISAIGQARKGKSYTLSKLMQHMSKKPSPSFRPFVSSEMNTPYTLGIWMYLLLDCSSSSNSYSISKRTYPCSEDDKQYMLLDIQGSYTESDDEAMRYATIVSLISSQTYLFLHQKLCD